MTTGDKVELFIIWLLYTAAVCACAVGKHL